MSPEAQQLAIAEACGWKCAKLSGHHAGDEHWMVPPDRIREFLPIVFVATPNPETVRLQVLGGAKKPMPDYLSDLNSIHEAGRDRGWHESTHDEGSEADDYFTELLEICCRFPGWPTYCATAAQRAEAFLRAIGKWKES